jgi:tetratricopeptide (TPR) repeat protein
VEQIMGLFDRLGDRVGKLFDDVFVPDDIKALLEQGKAALRAQDPQRALHPLKEAVSRRGDIAEGRLLLGVAQLALGDAQAAVQELSLARDLAPQNHEVSVELGRALLALGELKPAKIAFQLGLESEFTRPAAYAGLGECYARTKEHQKAIREFQKALSSARRTTEEMTPQERSRIALRLGECYAALQEEAAIPFLRQASTSVALEKPLRARAYSRLAESLKRVGDVAGYAVAYEEAAALEPQNASYLRGLAAAKKANNDAEGARIQILRSLELAPEDPASRNVLGTLLREAGDNSAALAEFERALASDPKALPILRNAARAALALGDGKAAERASTRLLEADEDDALGLAARGLSRVTQGELQSAIQDLEKAIQDTSTPSDVELILARALSATGQRERAIALTKRAVERDTEHLPAQQLLRELTQSTTPPKELAAISKAFYQFSLSHQQLGHLSPRIEEAGSSLDRPMLLVVMGEFNAGKSTFVNALVGENVAAMGVTPTTATINVLKFGAQRIARIWTNDGQSKEMSYEEAKVALTKLSAEETRRIDRVELMVPNPALEKVHLVDTPGLNSLLPEHEEVTRRFVEKADAVIWLFDVSQAGKSTEKRILELVKGHKAKTLGVVNKIDRAQEFEREEVFRFLRESLGEYFESLLGVSARKALTGALQKNEEENEASGFIELRAHLEKEYFTPSRAIVAAGVKERLRLLAIEAEQIAMKRASLLQEAKGAIAETRAATKAKAKSFRVFAVQEASAIGAAVLGLSRDAAHEVLDFARPRRSIWGSNEADPEDRAYLVKVLEGRLSEIVGDAKARALQRASQLSSDLSQALLLALPEMVQDQAFVGGRARVMGLQEASRARELEMAAKVYERFLAFAQGFLRGGRLDGFFQKTLRRLDLDLPTIEAALRDAFPTETESGIARPLSAWGEQAFSAWEDGINRLLGLFTAEQVVTDASMLKPAMSFVEVLSH